jgi:hypothetical protein
MEAITIPVGQPVTFEALRELNRTASMEELADAFSHLPHELREQAWEHLRLRAALNDWNLAAGETP